MLAAAERLPGRKRYHPASASRLGGEVMKLVRVLIQAAVLAMPFQLGAQELTANFESSATWRCVEDNAKKQPQIAIGPYGTDGSRGARVAYRGFDRGSERVHFQCALPKPGPEYTLEYSIRFDRDFQFVKGGKLPGLGPDLPMTGGHGIKADRWSVRPMFLTRGGLDAYVYHQDQPKGTGDPIIAKGFLFQKDRYYHIAVYVKVNSSPDARDGTVRLYVDNQPVAERSDLRYRAVSGNSALVAKFIFSTFHGGESPEWAPRDQAGKFTTVYADFDNFVAYPGEPRLGSK